MDETEGFGEFVAIVKAGSVSAAARELRVPRATLSRRLARLEERLGVRLLHRSTRRMKATLAGQELFRRASRLQQEAREAEAAVRQLDDVPRGLLRISTPPLGGTRELGATLLRFLQAWPEVELEVSASLRHVDLLEEGVDVALRAGRVRNPALISRRLFQSRRHVYAAPTTLEKYGTPQTLADLARFDCVSGWDPVTLQSMREWPLIEGGTVPVTGRLATNDLQLALGAVLDHGSLALLPSQIIALRAPDAAVPVLADLVGSEAHIWVVYPERAYLDPKVRAFVDHMVIEVPSIWRHDDEVGVGRSADGARRV